MDPLIFEKLKTAKRFVNRMSLVDKIKFVAAVSGKLEPGSLTTPDGRRFSEENILAVGLVASVAETRDQFDRIIGAYGGGYESDLRKGYYHNRGDVPNSEWRKGMRRLYYRIRAIIADVALPVFEDSVIKDTEAEPKATRIARIKSMLLAGAGPVPGGIEAVPMVMIPRGGKPVPTKIEDLTEAQLRHVEADLGAGINWSDRIDEKGDEDAINKMAGIGIDEKTAKAVLGVVRKS